MRVRALLLCALLSILTACMSSSSSPQANLPVTTITPPVAIQTPTSPGTNCTSIGFTGTSIDPATLTLNCGTVSIVAQQPFTEPRGTTSLGVIVNDIVFLKEASENRYFIRTREGACPRLIRDLNQPLSTTKVLLGTCGT